MTSRAVAGPAVGRGPRPSARAFTVLDELNCYFDSPAEPNNVQLEAWLPGHLSPRTLRAAVAAALAAGPDARARRTAGPRRAGYAWEFPAAADVDPVSVTGWRDEAELDAARARFLATAPELDRSPAFRLLLAQGPSWDSLILNAHHAAFDGRSCVRLLRLIADLYGRAQPTEADTGTGTGDLDRIDVAAPRSGPRDQPRRARRPSSRGTSPRPARKTTRIASQHAAGRAARMLPGYGLSLLEWPGVPAAPRPPGGSRATVNDLLIAALIETIARWNSTRTRSSGRIRISMPIDTRRPGNADELGNLSRLCTITAVPKPVSPRAADSQTVGPRTAAGFVTASLIASVACQTAQAKAEPGPLVGPVQAATARTRLPAPVKRILVRLALRSVGRLRCDTSLLSNLGNITDPPRFGELTPVRMWFSPSAHMPRGLSVGAVSVGGRLQVCFRYRKALLDDAAGRAFAAEYAAALSALADREPDR